MTQNAISSGYRRTPPLGPELAEMLVERAREDGFGTAEYRVLRDHLWGYAMPVVKDHLRRGTVTRLLLEYGRFVPISAGDRLALHSSQESRDELAVETLMLGEEHFRVVVRKGLWVPDRRASIETYFVTGCFLRFGEAYKGWSRNRTERLAHLYGLAPEPVLDHSTNVAMPDVAVATAETALAILRRADDATRFILSRLALGYTHAEVGEDLGISERAVEGRLYRFRRALRDEAKDPGPRGRAGGAA